MAVRGLFVTIEGGEGVGKSTNLGFLENFLCDKSIEVLVTREPGGTRLGEKIRELLLENRKEKVDAMTELLLIFAARAQHIYEVIEPALASGKWVLCDRFTDATYAYQCGGRGVASAAVASLENLVQGTLRPDYTILLDVPIATGMGRARERGELDRIELEDFSFFDRVRAAYLEQAQSNQSRYRVVDAGGSLERVQEQVAAIASELLTRWEVGRTTS